MGAAVPTENDLVMMARCIALSRQAASEGDFPFACVICKNGDVIVETTNRVRREGDVTRHAEMIAMSHAQNKLGKKLSGCTLYTNVEPCAMCSYCIRESRIGRVVYSIPSPMMGGLSKWQILNDKSLSRSIPEVFGRVPFIAGGVLQAEAEAVWRDWHPLIWKFIKVRGCFGGVPRAP
jgi:tRNA(adenine34) deaminase